MNRVELIGGLVRPPDLRYTPGGLAVCEVSIAVNDARYDSQAKAQTVSTTYVAVNAFGLTAETLAALDKGDEVYVLGQLSQRTIEKKDGTKEQKTRVDAHVVVVTRQRSGGSSPQRLQPASGTGRDPVYGDEGPF
jgi:single-strand DNA-binding protein